MTGLESKHVAGCNPISTQSPERSVIEADIAAFERTAPVSGSARFQVQDCLMDGQLYDDGKTIIVSSRLARLPQPQRYFIIAHEFAHYRLAHHAQIDGVPARILSHHAQVFPTGDVMEVGATELAHRREFEADADAVRMMHVQGLDPEEAARMFDSMGTGKDSATHPAFSRRAQAIRDVIATLNNGLSSQALNVRE